MTGVVIASLNHLKHFWHRKSSMISFFISQGFFVSDKVDFLANLEASLINSKNITF